MTQLISDVEGRDYGAQLAELKHRRAFLDVQHGPLVSKVVEDCYVL